MGCYGVIAVERTVVIERASFAAVFYGCETGCAMIDIAENDLGLFSANLYKTYNFALCVCLMNSLDWFNR